MENFLLVAGLTGVVALTVAAIARRLDKGIAVPLVIVGLLIGIPEAGPALTLAPEMVLVVLLVPLVFGESMSLAFLDLRRMSRLVLLLAVVLVVVSAFLVGLTASQVVPGMPLAVAFTLGAVLGPTDAVSVAAVARRVGLPHRLQILLEGESLVNDGTALTLLRVAITAAAAGAVSAGDAVAILGLAVLGGVAIGAVGGLLLRWVLVRSEDPLVANSFLLVTPFAIYFATDAIEGSGILAVVVAAGVAGHAVSKHGGYRVRLQIGLVWSHITFLLQVVAFFFIGLEIPNTLLRLAPEHRGYLIPLTVATLVVLFAARILFIGMIALLTPASQRASGQVPSRREWVLGAWSGTRGPISGLAAFSVPLVMDDGKPFPFRDLVLATTLLVILLTLLLSLATPALARRLRLGGADGEQEVQRVRADLARVGLDRVAQVVDAADRAGAPLPGQAVRIVLAEADTRVRTTMGAVTSPDSDAQAVRDAVHRLRRELLSAEREELQRLRDEEGLSDELRRRLQDEIDQRQSSLRTDQELS